MMRRHYFCAAGCRHEKVVELLLKNEADIKAESFYGSALHAAAESGYVEVVRLLLQEGQTSTQEIRKGK
jgi:ankyrin repeat protein